MPTLCYNNATSTASWLTVGNWWTDSAHTIPAGRIPVNGDTVYVDGQVTTGPSVDVTLASLNIGTLTQTSYAYSVEGANAITVTGLTVISQYNTLDNTNCASISMDNNSVAASGVAASEAVTCSDSAIFGGTANGSLTLNGYATINASTVVLNGNVNINTGLEFPYYSVPTGGNTYTFTNQSRITSFNGGGGTLILLSDTCSVTPGSTVDPGGGSVGDSPVTVGLVFNAQSFCGNEADDPPILTGLVVVNGEGLGPNGVQCYMQTSQYAFSRSAIQRGVNGTSIFGI